MTTQTMKHTPDKWELLKLDEPMQTLGGSYLIKSPLAPGGIAVTIGGLGKQEEANANLLAAAPELLEAGKKALDYLSKMHRMGQLYADGIMAKKNLENAIAKANGL